MGGDGTTVSRHAYRLGPAVTAGKKVAGRRPAVLFALLVSLLVAGGCGSSASDSASGDSSGANDGTDAEFSGTLRIGAIPDQDPEVLQRTYGLLSEYLESEMPGVVVEYVPVIDYQGAVAGFRVGDLDIVWFGGLTGVQARLETDGAQAIVQRDIDATFTSAFIANTDTGIEPFNSVDGLAALAGTRFTFGSESSTSGRLMPQSFLEEAGLDIDSDVDGPVGFSGSHDATIEQVEAGTYQTGALNSQVWDARVADGAVDTSRVIEVFRSPTYVDYHWLARPDVDDRIGDGATDQFAQALFDLDANDPDDAAILDLFGAGSFIPTDNAAYATIEAVGREAGLITQ